MTNDDLDASTSRVKPRVPPPATPARSERKLVSLSDDELTATALIPPKTPSGGAPLPAPRRLATVPPPRPATIPPSRPASVPPPTRMARPASFDLDNPKGRTQARGAPRVVKRASAPPPKTGPSTAPTAFSPAAVIKAMLESARAQEHNAGPSFDLLEDAADVRRAGAGSRAAQLEGAPVAMGAQELQSQPIPRSAPPPPASYPSPSPSYPAPSAAFPPPPASYPYGVSVPPHFMVPQVPYSDGRVDPPATSITWSHGIAGRPAMSWALALLAFGLFVGAGAVALTQRRSQGLAETTASFVDPARAPGGRAASQRQPQLVPVPVPAEPAAQPAAAHPGVLVAAPAPPPPTVTAAVVAPATVAAPLAAAPPVAAAPAPQSVAVARQPEPAKPAPAVATFKPPPRTWSAPPQPKPAARPADDSAAETKKTVKKGGDDDEMKKALEQLQKSQLERSLGD